MRKLQSDVHQQQFAINVSADKLLMMMMTISYASVINCQESCLLFVCLLAAAAACMQ